MKILHPNEELLVPVPVPVPLPNWTRRARDQVVCGQADKQKEQLLEQTIEQVLAEASEHEGPKQETEQVSRRHTRLINQQRFYDLINSTHGR